MRTQYVIHSAVLLAMVTAACSDSSSDDKPGNPGGTGPILAGAGGSAPLSGSGPGGTAPGGSGPAGSSFGGSTPSGGSSPTAGAPTAGQPGKAGAGGTGTGGAAPTAGSSGMSAGAGGASAGSGGMGGSAAGSGAGGGNGNAMGPCDIYEAATPSTPCVGAYSTIRRLRAAYTGPLFQVRSGSNAMNTGSGGETHDIMQSPDGFALKSAVDAACGSTTCTVSLLYDQSGRNNHLPVAKKGRSDGGQYAAMDDFETVLSNQGVLKVGGKDVYSLRMAARQGYRQTKAGAGVPLNEESQGLYMLADGTYYGTACCWDFGNVSPDPTRYGVMNTLFLGVAYWGRGAGSGPWYMADYEAGVWAGGSKPGDPGWGALEGEHPPNPNNPSLKVKFALGFLKTKATAGTNGDWALRMADAGTASTVTTAYKGTLPKKMHNEGAIVIGVGGDNSNNSWGTWYEGAVLAGFPSDDAEQAVLMNIKALGYGN